MTSRDSLPGSALTCRTDAGSRTGFAASEIVRAAGIIILCALALPLSTSAQEELEFNYDLLIRDSSLVVWLDLAPFISSRTVKQLRDGIDLELEYRVVLLKPKRWYGDEEVSSVSGAIRLSYQKITGEYRLADMDTTQTVQTFPSLAGLYRYLTDSIEVSASRIDALDRSRIHVAELRITAISLTDLNLSEDLVAGDGSASPFRYLFRQFLILTDYGRREYQVRSRGFRISELELLEADSK